MATFKKGFEYPDLFGEIQFEVVPEETCKKQNRKDRKLTPDLRKIETPLSISTDALPSYPAYDGPAPIGLIGFNECLKSTEYWMSVHFFLYDYMFTQILRHPEKYVATLSRFASVIAPDFSVCVDMSYDQAMFGLSASRVVANYLYENGVKVIPNVQWSTPALYDECFAGIPVHGMVAINCMGIKKRAASKYLWRLGYKEVLHRLDPSCIIRYGDKMPEEDESRSLYFPNERLIKLKRISYGR